MRQVGIQPDAVLCRADRELLDSIKRKLSWMFDVDQDAVVCAADAPSNAHLRGWRVLTRRGTDAMGRAIGFDSRCS